MPSTPSTQTSLVSRTRAGVSSLTAATPIAARSGLLRTQTRRAAKPLVSVRSSPRKKAVV